MSPKLLTDDLNNCIINFDQRILLTDLIDKYGGVLDDISNILLQHISEEEAKGIKYTKRYLIHGLEKDSNNEIMTIVAEEKLEEITQNLRDSYKALYSLEIEGGSKSPAQHFTPIKKSRIKLKELKIKEIANQPPMSNGTATCSSREISAASPEKKVKEVTSKKGSINAMFAEKKNEKNDTSSSNKNEVKSPVVDNKSKTIVPSNKDSSSKPKTSPTKSKSKTSPVKAKPTAIAKKGIGNFFAKQAEKPKTPVINKLLTPKKEVNTSPKKDSKQQQAVQNVQIKEEPNISKNLFDAESSSDEEETLEALKREVVSDHEPMYSDEENAVATTSFKRRRIVDSDNDDDNDDSSGPGPEKKVNREEEISDEEEIESEPPKAETYMDDEGFIVTVKAPIKKSSTKKSSKAKAVSKSPQKPIKTSPKNEKPKQNTAPGKTKQGSIMSFFSKK